MRMSHYKICGVSQMKWFFRDDDDNDSDFDDDGNGNDDW